MKPLSLMILLLSLPLWSSARVGPRFTPPVVETPAEYLNSNQLNSEIAPWWEIYQDTTLVRLVSEALSNNKNLLTTLRSIEQARLTLKNTRSERLPSVSLDVDGQYGNETYTDYVSSEVEQSYMIKPSISWEIDLFGKFKRMSEEQWSNLGATEQEARGVRLALIAEVVEGYFTLLKYDYLVQVCTQLLDSEQESYRLTEANFQHGNASSIDVSQARSSVEQVAATLPTYHQQIKKAQYALSLLTGNPPSEIVQQHTPLVDQPAPRPIPAGIPSDLLVRRPDIMESYFKLSAANAQIGVAQAMRFPSLSITANGGVLSSDIQKLFESGTWMWSLAGAISAPILNFGANKRKVKIAQEEYQIALLNYEQSYLQALSDVENALSTIQSCTRELQHLEQLTQSAELAYSLAQSRYRAGVDSYLQVLVAERTLLSAQQSYSEALSSHLSSYVLLYKALGGSWESSPEIEVAETVIAQKER